MSFRTVLAGAALVAALVAAFAPAGAGGGKRPVVVELYTSQGCSSCPPADAYLAQLASTRRDVLALSFPVTYWDMLGWKDTLASDSNTRRQKGYAAAMGSGGVYTPQAVIDGVDDLVGSRDAAIAADLAAREADMETVQVSLSATPKEIRVLVGPGRSGQDATIWLMHVLDKATVDIGGGENAGQKLTYRNVVRDVRAVGMWKGQQVILDLPRGDMASPPHDAIAVIVQQGGYGRIIGAAMLSKPGY
ncbi:MAG TPA: DUF1223 domain-containing protein [Rhizomicrobium sp.]|nr:DUF1223 domain-containing protein [Rhizomicrobium sp.]